MTNTLKFVFFTVSLLTLIFVILKVRKSQLQIADSIAWIIGAFMLIFMSVFSDLIMKIAHYFGFYSASNFILSMFIFFLLVLVFMQNIKLSILNEKLKNLNHYIALKETDETSSDSELY